ncbi:MAG: rhomboid family intramembrane serine protease [Nanoarchaeota archaeon]
MRYTALWLSAICVVVFAIQLIFGTDPFILDRALVWSEPWRLVTSVFAHENMLHLLSNLFALCLFGLVLEGRIGPKRVLFLFLFSGIVINIFSPYERSLGASGAIYAVIGALAVLRPMMVVWFEMMPMPMLLAALAYLIQDTVGFFIPHDNVANLAHISGLFIGGFIAALLWRSEFADHPKRKQRRRFDPVLESKIDRWEDHYMREDSKKDFKQSDFEKEEW